MKVLSDRANRVLYFGDNPSMPSPKQPSNDGFKKWCYQRFQDNGESWQFLETLQEEATYRARRLTAENDIREAAKRSDVSWEGRVFFKEIADLFEVEVGASGDSYLQIVDPESGGLVYVLDSCKLCWSLPSRRCNDSSISRILYLVLLMCSCALLVTFLHFSSPHTRRYKDFSHINADGELRLERRFREFIFEQPVCENLRE